MQEGPRGLGYSQEQQTGMLLQLQHYAMVTTAIDLGSTAVRLLVKSH